jgi:hypothetical protein
MDELEYPWQRPKQNPLGSRVYHSTRRWSKTIIFDPICSPIVTQLWV